jgi:hypothetical protein
MTGISPLKDGFGLLGEEDEYEETYFITLIFLDIHNHTLQKFDTDEYIESDIEILVNKANPTTFILNDINNDEISTEICKLVDGEIIIEDVIEIGFSPDCFYDKYLYGLEWYGDDRDYNVSSLFICLFNTLIILDVSNLYLQHQRKNGK